MYSRFFYMLATSFVIMHIVMYLHTYEWGHVAFSLTRLYMTVLMIAPMALVMLWFMRAMYKNRQKNIAIVVASLVIFAGTLALVRTQTPVDDEYYMKGMIPHHSIAILTSERANIKDPEVKKLADEIIKTQKEEIAEMKRLLKKIRER
jgi:uncharacterized protein (DUF305 family)